MIRALLPMVTYGLYLCTSLLSVASFANNLPAQLAVSPVDSSGQYTVSWHSSYITKDYLLLEDRGSHETVVQQGGNSFTVTAPIDSEVDYRLVKVSTVFANPLYVVPVYIAESTRLTIAVLAEPSITVPNYDSDVASNLTWTAITNAVSYTIEVQVDGAGWALADTSTTNSYAIPTGLATGRYQYRIIACTTTACAPPSNSAGFATQDETSPPSRTSNSVAYVRTYHDDPAKTQLQQETMQGARTDLLSGVHDNTIYDYDTSGNLTTVTNALSHITQMALYNARGQAGTITDVNGVVTELSYHPRGWLTHRTVKDPDGNTANDATTVFDYDAVGQLTKITLPDNSFLSYEYDDARRLTAIENTLGERIEYTLDNAGNRTEEVICASNTHTGSCPVAEITRSQSRVFDGLSRLRKDIGSAAATPASKTTRLDYDKNDNLEIFTDAKDQPTNQTFDALDRLVTQIDPDANNGDLTDNPTVTYGYDSQDRITSVTDQEGLLTQYVYNAWGDLTQLDSPDTGITNYRYDNAGNRTRMEDARGQVVIYKYDALNRLTLVIPVASRDELITYGYDDISADSGGQINYGIGRLTHIVDESGRTDYRYDARGNLINKTVAIDGVTFVTEYSYTIADRVESITYPSGRIVSYVRDIDGRIVTVHTQENSSVPVTAVVSSLSYKPFGPVDGYNFANGISRSLSFDTDYLLTDIEDTGGSAPMDWFYHYDANANIETIDDQTTANKDQDFSYDFVDRLKTADSLNSYGGVVFDYDGVGNRLTKTHTDGSVTTTESYTYDYEAYTPVNGVRLDGSHQLDDVLIQKDNGSADTTRNFLYNANGNTEQDSKADGTLLDLHYNALNRYKQLDVNSTATAWYQHNALGQRVKKTTLSSTIYYHYDEAGQLLAEMDAQGNVIKDYIFAGGMRVARYDDATPYYFHNDHLGRPIALTDGLGNVAWQVDYLPFGQVYNVVNNTTDQSLGFPGQILDGESGLLYNYFRDYDSSLGRYMQADPIGTLINFSNPQMVVAIRLGLPVLNSGDSFDLNHLYGYVAGNPIRLIDLLGLLSWDGEFNEQCFLECLDKTRPFHDGPPGFPDNHPSQPGPASGIASTMFCAAYGYLCEPDDPNKPDESSEDDESSDSGAPCEE